jgi:hypothetical protein
MELQDLLLTPFYLVLIYGIAYFYRGAVTNKDTKKYFMPALSVKLLGALGVGLIYQFYYGKNRLGGDTSLYFRHAQIVYEAFLESPQLLYKFLQSNGEYDIELFPYTVKMLWYHAPTEFIIVKFASILAAFTFCTYSSMACFFALLSFTGMWQMYRTFLKIYPHLHREMAIAVFFLPSVFFWGSGLLKDSLSIGALGWVFYGFYTIFIEKKKIISTSIILALSMYALAAIKAYILLSFLPPAIFWIVNENKNRIKNNTVRILLTPLALGIGIALALLSATNLSEGDARYDIDKISERSQVNTLYLTKQVVTGSAYDIGTFDGSLSSLATVGPAAIVVALYRPFLWESRNPMMLLSALESTWFIILTFQFFFKVGIVKAIKFIATKPILIFCIFFSLILGFGVGINSGNFGTLVRYKIPIMPFYLASLYIMRSYLKKPKKEPRLAATA